MTASLCIWLPNAPPPETQSAGRGKTNSCLCLGSYVKKSLAVKPVFVPVSLGATKRTKRPYRNFAQGLYG